MAVKRERENESYVAHGSFISKRTRVGVITTIDVSPLWLDRPGFSALPP